MPLLNASECGLDACDGVQCEHIVQRLRLPPIVARLLRRRWRQRLRDRDVASL